MSGSGTASFDTQNIKRVSEELKNACEDFIKAYMELESTVQHSAITGPVKMALTAKLAEKKDMFDAVRKEIMTGADYTAERAVKGEQLLDELSGDMQ